MGVQFAGNILVQSNGGPLPISAGGTGQTTAPTAINALLPVQTGNAGRLLSTDGTNVTWQAAVMTPGGADTNIQYNDAGAFGGSSKLVVNKSTGAVTGLSTFTGTGLVVSDAVATTRALKFQTAGSDRWLLQTTNVNETGSNVGSNFEFVRVADNGATSNQVYTVARLSGIVDFKTTPTINGVAIGTGAGTVTSVAGTGSVSGLTLSGTVTTSGSLTLGGTLSLTSGDVTSGLGFTPYNETNPAGYISGITSSDVTTALGFTPYNATNPAGYTTNTGTVTSVAGTGSVSGLTLTGTVTTTGSLTLGGTLSLTSGQVTSGLGFTPVNKAGDTMTGSLTATGFIGPLTGNASTATVLQTARAINGVSFDGSAPITVTAAAGTLTGTTLNSTVIASSLESVGTLLNLTVTNPIAGSVTGSSGSTTGNAATVTNGVYTTDTGTVTNTMLAGSIANAKLSNSTVTVGSTSIALGASATTLAGLTSVTSTSFTGALTGNASTSTTLATARNISTSGDATWTVSFNGSADATAALTLATVNASPVTASFQKITTNGKGLVTASTAVVASDITSALTFTPVNKAGDTMTGALILNADPTALLGAATKQYVDNVASGVNVHAACETGSTAPLASCTYNNGASGVGATLTATANASINTAGVGGYTTLSIGSRILIKNQATQIQNGIYNVSDLGSAGTPWILTRSTDFDGSPTYEIVAGDLTYVQEGTLAGTQWVETNVGTGHNVSPAYDYVIIGTDNIVFSQFAGAGAYTAGTGINIASNAISNTGVLSNVAGTGISVSGATGNVTVTNTGVLSITGTANQVVASASTGAITLSLPQSINSGAAPTFAGTNFTSIPNGALTNSSLTLGSTSMALGSTTTTVAGLSSVTSTTFIGALTGNATTATTATNIAGGAATQVPFQSGAGATAFSSDFVYDDTAKTLTVGTSGTAGYPVIIGGQSNSIYQAAGATNSLILRSLPGNHMRFYTDYGTGSTRGGDFRFQAGGSDSGTGGNIQFSPGQSTSGVSGAIRMIGSVEYLMNSYGTLTVGTWPVDFSLGGMYVDFVLGGNITFTFLNPVQNNWGEYTFRCGANPSGYTITWPAAVSWATGTAPFISATGSTTIKLISTDAGVTYLGSVVGNSTITNDTTTNATYYPTLATVTAGPSIVKVSSTKLSFNPSTGVLTSTTFSGAHSGSGAGLTSIPNSALTNSSVTINGTSIALGASGTVTAAAGTLTGSTLNSTVTASSLTSVGTLTSITDSGNLTFTGTGNRITGDFNNATVSSRVLFQSSASNLGTSVAAIPNGTATSSSFVSFGASDPNNSSYFGLNAFSAENRLTGGITGTGTYSPMTFYTSGAEKLRIAADTTGTYTFGGTAPRITGDFSNTTPASRVLFQSSTTNGTSTIGVIPNGTANAAGFTAFNDSATTNYSSAGLSVFGTLDVRVTSGAAGTGSYLPLTMYTSGSERMRIDTSGNVGIGLTPSGTYKLEVNGTAFATGLTVTNNGNGVTQNGNTASAIGFSVVNANAAGYAQIALSSNAQIKTLRCSPSGSLELVNTANSAVIASVSDAGALVTSGSTQSTHFTSTESVTAQFGGSAATGIYLDATNLAVRCPGSNSIYFQNSGGSTTYMVSNSSSLAVTGAITATGNVTAYFSDDRLKTRTGKIENALDKVATLDTFYYHANETAQALGFESVPEVGISAQQVQAIMPEVVAPAPIDDKYLTVRYERLVPLLIAAIQELQAEVAALKAR